MCPKWQDIVSVSSKKIGSKFISMPYDEMFPYEN